MADDDVLRENPIASGTTQAFASDDIGGIKYVRGKTAIGPNGTFRGDLDGRDLGGGSIAAYTDPRVNQVRIQVTPVISTVAYASGDQVGGVMEFANAARLAGTGGRIESVVIHDKDNERAELELHLFTQTVAVAADNAVASVSDADVMHHLGYVPIYIGNYSILTASAVAVVTPGLPYVCAATSLFGTIIIRQAATYAAVGDLTVSLIVVRD